MPRYHINENNELVQCKSWLRSCKFKDFATIEEGREALFYKKAQAQYDADLKALKEKFSNRNAVRELCTVDFSGLNKKKSLRNYVEQLEEEYFSKGQRPDFYSCYSQLLQSNITYNRSHHKVYVRRITNADYVNVYEVNKWSLEISAPYAKFNDKPIVHDFDLNNDFENEINRASNILRQTVIANGYNGISEEEVQKQTDFLVGQFAQAYCFIEELDDALGVCDVWEVADGYGDFAESDLFELLVNVNYQTSSFTPRSFHKFLHENKYYQAIFPNRIDVRVFDNEAGRSANSWTIRYYKGEWKMFAQIGEEMYIENVESPDHAYETMKDFIKYNMPTNDDETVEKKATYIRDLVSGVSDSIQSFIKWKEENPLYEKVN